MGIDGPGSAGVTSGHTGNFIQPASVYSAMNSVRIALIALALVIALAGQQNPAANTGEDSAPGAATEGITNEEVAVYQAFLAVYTAGSKSQLNFANRTTPLRISDGDFNGGCLQGLTLDRPAPMQPTGRLLPSEVLAGIDAVFVDAEQQRAAIREQDEKGRRGERTGASRPLLAFAWVSDIAFDREHRYAVLSYGSMCGMLCGNGGTEVFEKTNGRWERRRPSGRPCGRWIS